VAFEAGTSVSESDEEESEDEELEDDEEEESEAFLGTFADFFWEVELSESDSEDAGF